MKKLLLSTACLTCLFADIIDDVEILKLENQLLKNRLDFLEQQMQKSNNEFYFNINDFFNDKAIEIIDNNTAVDDNHFYTKTYSSFYQIGNVVSTLVQKRTNQTSKIDIKTFNINTSKEYSLNDILKDKDTFMVFIKSKNIDKNELNITNFYIKNNGVVFCDDALNQEIKISFDEIKVYLKEDFLKELGIN